MQRTQGKDLHDESRMDEWLDGRRDVDLDVIGVLMAVLLVVAITKLRFATRMRIELLSMKGNLCW